ncbi:MAG: uncharacterized protein JWN44_6834 [Myxococcales bacterium]|nr:uncharacterized protein [Myxococcales bacterium]
MAQESSRTEERATREPARGDETSAGWRQTRVILKVIFLVLVTAAAGWLLFVLRGILLLVLFSVFFAYLLAPIVELVHAPLGPARRRVQVPRAAAIVLVYLFFFGVIAVSAYLLLPRVGVQLTELGRTMPSYIAEQREHARSLDSWYQRTRLPPGVRAALATVGGHALDGLSRHGEQLSSDLLAGMRFLPWLVLIPVIAFFLLKDAETFRRSALLALPTGRVRWRGSDFLTEVNTTLAFFIRAQLTACAFIGTVCTIGYLAMGVPYGLVLGGAAAVLEVIPVVGPITALVAAVLFASTRSVALAVGVLTFLVILRMVHDYAVYPRLIARGIKLHPLAIILAVLCGSTIGGLLGLFLAIPVTAVISISYRYLRLHLGSDGLLAELIHSEPAPDLPAVVEPSAVAPHGHLSGVTVLVVDNDDDARTLLIDVLEREGAETFGASSAAEALTLLRAVRPKVLISDLAMPGEDGFDLMRQVRALAPDRGGITPAVALTGYATDEDRARALAAGFQRHLPKPVNPNELARVVWALAKTGT